MATALIFDIGGKQKYIFSTTMLRSIVGASARMDMLSSEFKDLFKDELVYSGGGNGVAVFKSSERLEAAKNFLLAQSAILGLSLPHVEKELSGDELSWDDLKDINGVLAEAKRKAWIAAPPLNLPFSSQCQICGQGASCVGFVEEKRVCQRCREKLQWNHSDDHGDGSGSAHRWLAKRAYGMESERLFLLNLSELPQAYKAWRKQTAGKPNAQNAESERSLMAVVFLDGNGMGRRIEELRHKGVDEGSPPRKLLKSFSEGVETLLCESLTHAMHKVFGERGTIKGKIPFRPLIAAGDDICFVIAPELAFDFVQELACSFNATAEMTDTGLKGVTLSAGIAVVHSNFPLSEAVGLAEELLASAKKGGKQLCGEEMPPAMVDFAVVLDGKMDTLSERRLRETHFLDPLGVHHVLTRRPYLIMPMNGLDTPDINTLTAKVTELRKLGLARSKIKLLREVLREGPNERKDRLTPYRRSGHTWKVLEKLLSWNCSEAHTDNGREVHEAFLDILEVHDFLIDAED